jgi:membrane protein YdbS with pleckstrin-like domain
MTDPQDTAHLGIAPVPGPRAPGSGLPEPELVEDPPAIAPEELEGLTQRADQGAAVRRVSPLQDVASELIARYLFPTERFRGEWRRHKIHLVTPIAVGVVGTVGLGLLGGFLSTTLPAGGLVGLLAVLVWLAVMVWVGWRFADWHFDRFILTNKRVMKVDGIIKRNVGMMPLARVTDMKYEQSWMGRLLNYGTFVLESAGQDQALREVEHLPNPNELYLRVVEEMYEPDEVEKRVSSGEEEDDQGDA